MTDTRIERPMPNCRETIRQKVVIGGRRVYLDVGLYEDGQPGEVFIVVEKTGSDERWMFDEVARLASKLLQHGCPLEEVAQGWLGTKGKICGPVQYDVRIKNCTSVLDFTARHLLIYFAGREDLAHVKAEEA